MSKKVLTINECFSDNLGDQAIALSLSSLLKGEGVEVVFADFTGNKFNRSSTRKTTFNSSLGNKIVAFVKRVEVLRLTIWCLKNVNRMRNAIKKDIDFAVIGGGQLILSNAFFPISLYLWTLLLKFYKKDVYLFAIGSGNTFTAMQSYLISASLLRVKGVYTRDVVSRNKLKGLFNIDSKVVPDVAYSFPELTSTSVPSCCNENIVGIVDYNVFTRYAKEINQKVVTESEYMDMWLEKINIFKLKEITLVATTYTDLEQSHRFYEFLIEKKLPLEIQFVDSLLTLSEYCSCLQVAKSVFSGRMHSLILAERFASKVFVWPISQKIISYQNEISDGENLDVKVAKLKYEISELVNEN
jgi:polysaccharide pyruvyl transferase WcaK-like protein